MSYQLNINSTNVLSTTLINQTGERKEVEGKRKVFEKHWQDFIAAPAFDLAEK
jgi:hypothetical protein